MDDVSNSLLPKTKHGGVSSFILFLQKKEMEIYEMKSNSKGY